MTFDTIGAYDTYLDGSFAVTQLTTVEFVIEGYDPILIGVSELRDISAPVTDSVPNYDYDSLLTGGDDGVGAHVKHIEATISLISVENEKLPFRRGQVLQCEPISTAFWA